MDVILTFTKGKNGPIAYFKEVDPLIFSKGLTFVEGRGKVCLVNRKSPVLPSPGETWICKIDIEKPRYLIVTPKKHITHIKVRMVYPCRLEEEDKQPAQLFSGKLLKNFSESCKISACDKCHYAWFKRQPNEGCPKKS